VSSILQLTSCEPILCGSYSVQSLQPRCSGFIKTNMHWVSETSTRSPYRRPRMKVGMESVFIARKP